MDNKELNLFKNKTKEELLLLYEQLLEMEKVGFKNNETELRMIKDKYLEKFKSDAGKATALIMMRADLLYTISDIWYKENKQE